MKDLRISIVSWNAEKLLERCLKSLPDACHGLEWECIVVDNASQDASVGATLAVAQTLPQISMIANATNLGFAKACNQGADFRLNGRDESRPYRYLLFLNPDTFCHPDSLARLIHLADERPRSGILGPRLVYPDGRPQPSVRRFPDVWSQAGILLKLHHFFPHARIFRHYFAKDIDEDREQQVEQIMGACFLVRRECWEEIGGFDERFFLWFEEVDRCKTAIEKGWNVTYLPQIQIVHHGGESFSKVLTIEKQRYYNDSLCFFFQKWHRGWRAMLLQCLVPISIALASFVAMARHRAAPWIALTLGIEFFSAVAIFHPVIDSIGTLVAALFLAFFGWKKPLIGLGVLLLELLIGSKGGLLQFGEFPDTVNGRVILTASFFLGWLCTVKRAGIAKTFCEPLWQRKAYLVLFALIGFATLRGILIGNPDVYHDANAWIYFAMLFPVLNIASRYRERIRREFTSIFFVGLFWLAFKTFALAYLFSMGRMNTLYFWIRLTGVGEITPVIGTAHRIFMQSEVYAVAAWISAFIFWMRRGSSFLAWLILSASSFILAVSLSRSFWIGSSVGGFVAIFLLLVGRERLTVRTFLKRLWGPITAKALALALFAAIIAPTLISNLFFGRANISEPAAASRWLLLPKLLDKIQEHPILGSGFGATVTYVTKDPRILESHSDGVYTTTAFEWGWLDHWVKFGILGIPVMLWILLSLGRRLWKSHEPLWFRTSAVSSLVAIGSIHLFTPYLNHPLGFLYIFVGEAIIALNDART